MQIIVKNIRVPVTEPVDSVIEMAKKKLRLTKGEFISASIHKRSVDARRRAGHDIELVCSVTVECELSPKKLSSLNPVDFEIVKRGELEFPKARDDKKRPLIVGF